MAFADTAVRNVLSCGSMSKVTLAEACEVGDLLAYSTGWVLADASDGSKAAKFVALDKGEIGDEINVASYAMIEGPTGMTPGNSIYLSDTAGGYSDSAGSVSQVVGVAVSATLLQVTPVPAASEQSDIAAGTLVNADVADAAAIAFSKLAALTSAHILVGSDTNVATDKAVTGDVTITNAGVTAIGAEKVTSAMLTPPAKLRTVKTSVQDIDTIGAANYDEVILVPSTGIEITEVRIVYDKEQSGTVAGGGVKVGTQAGGEQIVASTALENTKAVGYKKVCTLVEGTVAAGTPIFVRITGVAATQAGAVHVEMDYYTIDPDAW